MSVLVFYPIITNYLFHEIFIPELFFERIIFSAMLLMSGLLFNRFRVISLILAFIPLLLIAITYLTIPENFNFKRIGFILAILILIASGFYYHFKAIRLKKELLATTIDIE
jgi:sulfite exporter TauE/SafE